MVNPNSQPQNTPRGNGYDDEISLIDLWLVLVRRKLLIISVFFMCLVLGSVYAFTRPVQYEYRTGIELARVTGVQEGKPSGNVVLLVSVEHSVDLLENVIIPAEQKAFSGEFAHSLKTKVENRKGSYILTLSTVTPPEAAQRVQQLHKAVATEFSKTQRQELQRVHGIQVNPLKARAEILRGQIQAIEAELETLSNQNQEKSATREFIIAQRIGDLRRELAQARLALADSNSSAEAILNASQDTRIAFLVAQSTSPIGAKKQLIIGLSVLLGAMLGIMGAFMAEFFRKVAEASQLGKEGSHSKGQ